MFTNGNRGLISALILAGASVWITTGNARAVTLKSEYRTDALNVVQNGALLSLHPVIQIPLVKRQRITVTAYSSSPDETDDTPDITASGTKTRKGVAAANFLPFGSKVRLPEFFGDHVFTVEDRMNARFSNRLDIWFPSKEEAKRFGLRVTEVEIEI